MSLVPGASPETGWPEVAVGMRVLRAPEKLTLRPLATLAILCCTSCSCETRALALTASTFISVSVMLVPIDTLAQWRAAEFKSPG